MIGIDNVNEFYTHHYLAAIVGSDIRPHLERWRQEARERDASPPWRRLARLQREFFRHKEGMERRRSGEARVAAHLEITTALLDALGYALRPLHRDLDAGPLPLLAAYQRGDGEPLLWLLPAASAHRAEEGVLARTLLAEQHAVDAELPLDFDPRDVHRRSVEELVTDAFQLKDPPRFVLMLGDLEWVLADRGKWPEQRLLRFDLEELLGRRDAATLEAFCALLHRETLAPESGTSLVDTLDDSSHKHAYKVSEDLKYALQASIEAIGNEAIRYRREVSKEKVYGEEIEGQRLAIECIRYMYRVLFLLYIEARPELGYAPMGSEAYRLGYSFERLRDLEMLELETEEARQGFTIDLWLKRLFEMVHGGAGLAQQQQTFLGTEGRVRSDLDADRDQQTSGEGASDESDIFANVGSDWCRESAVRSQIGRRTALVEMDVLVAMALGLTLDQLQTIYRVQFFVLRANESDTWYDKNGRIVFTVSKGLPGVGLPRSKKKGDPNPCWSDVQHMSEEAGYAGSDTVTQVVIDDTLPGGPREKTIVYQAPWIRCDREKDYEVAWKHFAERFGKS